MQPTPITLEALPPVRFLGNEIAVNRPIVTTWGAGSPARVPFDEMITAQGKYVPRKEMRLAAAYPIVEGYRGRAAAGYHAVIEDPLQFNSLRATVSYSQSETLEDQDWHADIEYQTLRWNVRYRHNDADFYDLFGPTERSRKGDVFSLGYRRSIVYDPPRKLDFTAGVAHYTGLDTLPDAQEVGAQFDTLTTAHASLEYSNTTSSLGAVDHEKGFKWRLNAGASRANDEVFTYGEAGIDVGTPLPLKNSSAWLYTAAGVNDGDDDSPLASSYLGGFGNNFVDDRAVKRYRETQSFPGFEINEIDAQKFAKAVAEINLPPARFRDVGTPSLYLSSARPAVFAGVLATETAAGESRTYQSVGAQVDFNFTVALRLPMVLSLGYAESFEGGERRGSEVMLSLKIM